MKKHMDGGGFDDDGVKDKGKR